MEVKQTTGEYALKEPGLSSYRVIVQKLMDQFSAVTIQHRSWLDNRHPDTLTTLASKVEVVGKPSLKFLRELCLVQLPKSLTPKRRKEIGGPKLRKNSGNNKTDLY